MQILFLGYDKQETDLIDFLLDKGVTVEHTKDVLSLERIKSADLILSFGYRHLLSKTQIAQSKRPIVNLHISYLPFNRGAHPVFWAAMEQTPFGVSIHEIDAGIDTGPVLVQSLTPGVSEQMSFREAHKHLLKHLETLFKQHWSAIRENSIQPKKQMHKGTFHNASDLPDFSGGWNATIGDVRRQLTNVVNPPNIRDDV